MWYLIGALFLINAMLFGAMAGLGLAALWQYIRARFFPPEV